MNKKDFIYKKHGISYLHLISNRIIFFMLLFLFFYIFPHPTFIFCKMLQYHQDKIIKHYIFCCIFLALIFTFSTIFFANISLKLKHCFNIFVILTFNITLIIYVVWEIIYYK